MSSSQQSEDDDDISDIDDMSESEKCHVIIGAVENDKEEKVRKFIGKVSEDVLQEALERALDLGSHGCMDLLVHHAPNLDAALMHATCRYCAWSLIYEGANADWTDGNHCVLTNSIENRANPDIVEVMLTFGNAVVDFIPPMGLSALMIAARDGEPECLKVLLNGRLEDEDDDSDSEDEEVDPEIMADVDLQNGDGNSALHFAAGEILRSYRPEDQLKCLKILLSHQADVTLQSSHGQNALEYFLQNSHNTHLENLNDQQCEMIELLYVAGCSCDPSSLPQCLEKYSPRKARSMSLVNSCREAIKSCIQSGRGGYNMFYHVPKLHLPATLSSLLLCHITITEETTDD